MPRSLSLKIKRNIVDALRRTPVAQRVAREFGVATSTVWRLAQRHGIELTSLSEHLKARRMTPEFIATQAEAARRGASRWLKEQHKKPKFHGKSVAAARRNLTRLNRDPAFRDASRERLRKKYEDPEFRRKQAKAASKSLSKLHQDPDFRRKQEQASRKARSAIQAIAPGVRVIEEFPAASNIVLLPTDLGRFEVPRRLKKRGF
jgi:hypothetical protein